MKVEVKIDWYTAPRVASPWEEFTGMLSDLIRGESEEEEPLENDDLWNHRRVLYAYKHPKRDALLYLGKAWGATVWQRRLAPDKNRVFEEIRRIHSLAPHEMEILVGLPRLAGKRKLTRTLLADIESLLIYYTEPCGNRQNKSSYRCNEGFAVRCTGDWPLRQKTYVDEFSMESVEEAQ